MGKRLQQSVRALWPGMPVTSDRPCVHLKKLEVNHIYPALHQKYIKPAHNKAQS